MIPGTQWDDYQDTAPVLFNDGRSDDDASLTSESLDTFSFSIESIDV